MPCGRMSIASRSRSWDFRASAIAASASARLRTISPISADDAAAAAWSFGTRLRWPTGDAGDRRMLQLLAFFGRTFGIRLRPNRILRRLFSDKCLKKWYLLPHMAKRPRGSEWRLPFPIACFRGELRA